MISNFKLKDEENCEARELDLERAVSESPTRTDLSRLESSSFQTLSDDDQDESDHNEIFYLSKTGEKFPVTKTDLKGLRPNEWLNDSILNFHLQYVH